MMSAEHTCMSARGVRQPHVTTVTSRFLGQFESDASLRDRFIALVHAGALNVRRLLIVIINILT